LAASQTLEKLLVGTGLTFVFIDEDTLTILAINNSNTGERTNETRSTEKLSAPLSNNSQTKAIQTTSQTNIESQIVTRSTVGSHHRKHNSIEEVVVVGSQITGTEVTNLLSVIALNSANIASIAATSGDELFRDLPSQLERFCLMV